MKLVNLPNLLTLLRIILIPVFITYMLYGKVRIAVCMFIMAAITDVLDGYVARALNQRTDFGAFLDPIADKILINSTFIIFAFNPNGITNGLIPLWFVITVISRDFIIVFGYLFLFMLVGRVKVIPNIDGKITALLQVGVIMLVLLHVLYPVACLPVYMRILVVLTALFTIISGIRYIWRGITIINKNE